MTNDYCEICNGQGAHGLSLCHAHLDAWLRSPERRALPTVEWTDLYQDALDRFVTRITSLDQGKAGALA